MWQGAAAREGALELAIRAAQRLLGVDASAVNRAVDVVREGEASQALAGLHNVLGAPSAGNGQMMEIACLYGLMQWWWVSPGSGCVSWGCHQRPGRDTHGEVKCEGV